MPPLGLYVHVPFCASICRYCTFNRGLFDAGLKARYVSALEAEILRSAAARDADTIYFGGGTPSLLEPAEVARLVRACREAFRVDEDAEVTLEANPETVDAGRLRAFVEAGVTRLSLGVQSFRDEELARLGRIHDAARARLAFRQARDAGFDNVSLDLMLWLPGQALADLDESLVDLLALRPEHASLYLLELHPNAPLRDEMARAGWSQAPDDDAAAMYLHAMDRLEREGYLQYEISNVARPGRRSRHNMKYWTDGEWLGFGCAAHSTLGALRWNNLAGAAEYVRRVGAGETVVAERRPLTRREQAQEALFMGLRLNDGVSTARIRRDYGIDTWQEWGPRLEPFVEAALLCREGETLRLTREGMLISNEVMSAFLEDGSTIK